MILPQKRPTRTTNSMVWGGTRAEDLQTSTIFRWNAAQSRQFADFLRIHGENSRTTADLDPLLIQLNLDGYQGIITHEGKDVEKIILDKVKAKLRNVHKAMPVSIGQDKTASSVTEKAQQGQPDTTTVKYKKQYDQFFQPQPPIAVNSAFIPQFTFTHGVTKQGPEDNLNKDIVYFGRPKDARSFCRESSSTREDISGAPDSCTHSTRDSSVDKRHQDPIRPAQMRPMAKPKASGRSELLDKEATTTPRPPVALPATPAHPFIRMPKDYTPQISDRTETAASPVQYESAPVSEKQANRKNKARRINEAWHTFQAVLLEVDQEPDEDEDEELYNIMAQLLYMNRKTMYNKGVLPLVHLAELEER